MILAPEEVDKSVPVQSNDHPDTDDTAKQQLQHHTAAAGIQVGHSFVSQTEGAHQCQQKRRPD